MFKYKAVNILFNGNQHPNVIPEYTYVDYRYLGNCEFHTYGKRRVGHIDWECYYEDIKKEFSTIDQSNIYYKLLMKSVNSISTQELDLCDFLYSQLESNKSRSHWANHLAALYIILKKRNNALPKQRDEVKREINTLLLELYEYTQLVYLGIIDVGLEYPSYSLKTGSGILQFKKDLFGVEQLYHFAELFEITDKTFYKYCIETPTLAYKFVKTNILNGTNEQLLHDPVYKKNVIFDFINSFGGSLPEKTLLQLLATLED